MKNSQKSVASLFLLAACLAGYPANHAQVAGTAQDYNVITLAGRAGSSGSTDGTGNAARFNFPWGVAVDSAGIVFIADSFNHTIRKLGPGGVVTTLAGKTGSMGSTDGTGIAARFNGPCGVAVDRAGNLYVADTGNYTIRKIGSDGVVTTLAGKAGSWGSADGTGAVARFSKPEGVTVDSAGILYVTDAINHTIRQIRPGGVVTTLAGLAGSPGITDGTANTARFYWPAGVAMDSANNLYVADANNYLIRQLSPGGVVTTLAGLAGRYGSADGLGSTARFNLPRGAAVDNAGNLYLADTVNHTIRQIGTGGMVTTLAGLADNPGSTDGLGIVARFNFPFGVAVDSMGNLYVADSVNHTIRMLIKACLDVPIIDRAVGPVGVARQLDTSPQTAITWQWQILQRPSGSTNAFSSPLIRNPDFIPDVAGLYVFQLSATNAAGQFGNRTVDFWAGEAPVIISAPTSQTAAQGDVIRLHVTAQGLELRYQWFKEGLALPGQTNASLFLPNIQHAAAGSYTVVVSNPAGTWTSPAVVVSVIALSPWSAAPFERLEGEPMEFTAVASGPGPWRYQWSKNDVDISEATNALLSLTPLRESDSGQYSVTVQNEAGYGKASAFLAVKVEYQVYTLAGLAESSGSTDGTGNSARFRYPQGVAVDSTGNVYVADSGNHTIRLIGPGAVVTTLAGLAGNYGSTDAAGNAARFGSPSGVAVDSTGNVYVADSGNHTIRLIGPGAVVTTLAGRVGSFGSADGKGSAARFWNPLGLAADSTGIVYVADRGNDVIRKIAPGGMVTTLAGKAGPLGSGAGPGNVDGPGSDARFYQPSAVAVDGVGNVYVADTLNNAIRKIGPGGLVTTLAGKAGIQGSDAQFNYPYGVAADSAGNVYVVDTQNHTIRKIGPSGVLTTLAGKAGNFGSADGMGSSARFNYPHGVAVDSAGKLYVTDLCNHTIRVLTKINSDRPTIDSLAGPLGVARQLDTRPQTAAHWAWQILQRPTDSTAELSSLSLRNPTFTPDKPGRYVFQLATTDPSGARTTRTLEFTAFDLGPLPPFSLRALRSGSTLMLAWTTAQDCLLESADRLGSNAVWLPVPGVTTNSITLPLGVTNQYFRLRK